MVREGLRSLLAEHAVLCVVAEAADGQHAIEATRRITAEFPESAGVGVDA